MHETYMEYIKETLNNCFDVKYRDIQCKEGIIHLVFIDNICDVNFISEYIIKPLINLKQLNGDIEKIKKEVLYANSIGDIKNKKDAVQHILSGDVAIMFSFMDAAIFCEAKKYIGRAVEQPDFDPVLRGPKESFNELLMDNISLIRKRIMNPALKIDILQVGSKSNTFVALLYMDGIAPEDLVQFVKKKINGLKCEFILGTYYIEEELKSKNTTLDTIGYTEKPDVVVSRLFEGRVAVLVNGSPNAMTAPYFFLEIFQASDDYQSNKSVANMLRAIRYGAFFASLLLPGFYIALSTYHYSLIPSAFIFKLAVARAGVPFPTVVEVYLMQTFFELSREAGKRLPTQIGQALSIVSALILGDSAVGAGLTSEITVVVVGMYAITSFINPRLTGTTMLWSFFTLAASAMFGLHGFYIIFIVFIAHISSLKSCGYPFLFPLGTPKVFNYKNKDLIFRSDVGSISRNIFKRGKRK